MHSQTMIKVGSDMAAYMGGPAKRIALLIPAIATIALKIDSHCTGCILTILCLYVP